MVIVRGVSRGVSRGASFSVLGNGAPEGIPFSATKLLLHGDGTNGSQVYVDSSVNSWTVSQSGTNSITTSIKKFGTGSINLSGSGFLTIADNAELEAGGSDFCIDTWFRLANIGNVGAIFRKGPDGGADIELVRDGANLRAICKNAAGTDIVHLVELNGIPNDNEFHHYAFTRQGSTFRLFIDGVLVDSATGVTDAIRNSTTGVSMGKTQGSLAAAIGYIDELRYVVGHAIYTANFTPPTKAYDNANPLLDPYFSNTSLLLHFNGADGSTVFTDSSSKNQTAVAVNQAQLDTAWFDFGTASAKFDGTNDSIRITTNAADFTFGTSDFTVEMTARFNTVPAASILLYDTRNGPLANTPGLMVNASGKLCPTTDGAQLFAGTTTIVPNTTYKIAVCRSGTTTRLFLNGVLEGSVTNDNRNYTIGAAGEPFKIAMNGFNSTSNFDGWIDELRVTKGVSRYIANYTPATVEFPNS